MRKEERKQLVELAGQQSNGHLEYGLGKNCYLPKIYNKTIDKWRNNR